MGPRDWLFLCLAAVSPAHTHTHTHTLPLPALPPRTFPPPPLTAWAFVLMPPSFDQSDSGGAGGGAVLYLLPVINVSSPQATWDRRHAHASSNAQLPANSLFAPLSLPAGVAKAGRRKVRGGGWRAGAGAWQEGTHGVHGEPCLPGVGRACALLSSVCLYEENRKMPVDMEMPALMSSFFYLPLYVFHLEKKESILLSLSCDSGRTLAFLCDILHGLSSPLYSHFMSERERQITGKKRPPAAYIFHTPEYILLCSEKLYMGDNLEKNGGGGWLNCLSNVSGGGVCVGSANSIYRDKYVYSFFGKRLQKGGGGGGTSRQLFTHFEAAALLHFACTHFDICDILHAWRVCMYSDNLL